MKHIINSFVFIILFQSPLLFSQSSGLVDLRNTTIHSINSKYVQDKFRIEIYLPTSYNDSSEVFSVLYLLDSDRSFAMAYDIVRWLNMFGELEDLIIVGISYGGEWWEKRSRDYTPTHEEINSWGEWPLSGGAENFQKFIEYELFPYIEANYRADENNRTISGLSLGGLFATFSLFTNPSLFSKYIIISPALIWDKNKIIEYENRYRSKNDTLNVIVFTAIGDLDENLIIEPWYKFNKIVKERNYKNLLWEEYVYTDETHISVYPAAFTRGLKTVYNEGK
jgi:predicted alpha/beta superfamily hydrolase